MNKDVIIMLSSTVSFNIVIAYIVINIAVTRYENASGTVSPIIHENNIY